MKLLLLILFYKLHIISKNRFINWFKESIQKSGALYVKLAQNATLLHDLFDKEILDELRSLQDNVDVEYIRLKIPNIQYNPYPIAAGSIAQVYKGKLDNKYVAIKVVRPSVIKQIKSIKRIRFMILNLMKVYKHANFIFSRILNIIDNLFDQTDLTKEVENMDLFRNKIGDSVIIPKVYNSLSNNNMIVMDYIDDIKSIYFVKDSNENNIMANALINLSSKMMFDIGILHTDMHPGNIYWDAKNKQLVLFDFGTVYKLNEYIKNKLVEMNVNFLLGRIDNVAKNHFQITLNNFEEIKDLEKFSNCISLIEKHFTSSTSVSLIKEMNSIDKSFCSVNLNTGNYEMFINQIAQLISILNPEINYYKEMLSLSINQTLSTLGRINNKNIVETISISI